MTPSQAAMLDRANEELIDAAMVRIREHAQAMFAQGATTDEVNAVLRAYVVDLQRWRVAAYRKIKRAIDEPSAPSHEVHEVSAREQLAAARARMTPEEIAEHALGLAGIIEAQDELHSSMNAAIDVLTTAIAVHYKFRTELQISIRQVESLFRAHKKAAARALLSDIAAVEIVRDQVPNYGDARFVRATDIPGIFGPAGGSIA